MALKEIEIEVRVNGVRTARLCLPETERNDSAPARAKMILEFMRQTAERLGQLALA